MVRSNCNILPRPIELRLICTHFSGMAPATARRHGCPRNRRIGYRRSRMGRTSETALTGSPAALSSSASVFTMPAAFAARRCPNCSRPQRRCAANLEEARAAESTARLHFQMLHLSKNVGKRTSDSRSSTTATSARVPRSGRCARKQASWLRSSAPSCGTRNETLRREAKRSKKPHEFLIPVRIPNS